MDGCSVLCWFFNEPGVFKKLQTRFSKNSEKALHLLAHSEYIKSYFLQVGPKCEIVLEIEQFGGFDIDLLELNPYYLNFQFIICITAA